MAWRMKRWACTLVVLSVVLCGGALAAAADNSTEEGASAYKDGWTLTFADEFDGETIDQTKWNVLPVGIPYAPRKDGYWSQADAFLDGQGHLIIQVSERDGAYHAGAINSLGKFEQAYGYYEIRAQLPKEQGFWTAFWLMADGVHQVGNEGRDGTEIDIFESPYSQSDHIHHALHWDGYGTYHRSIGRDVHIPGIYEGFHTFALEWTEDEYIFFVDGVETWRTSAGGISEVPSFLKVTAEVGTWGGDIRKANLPAQMIVDYVRVYERDHKIEIESPQRATVVAADAPVRFRVAPEVAVQEVRVLQNDVEIYRGSAVPTDLSLSIPIEQPEEEHRLTVIVTGHDGKEYERSVRFSVQQLSLVFDTLDESRVRGHIDLSGSAGFGRGEKVLEANLFLTPIRDGLQGEPVLLYSGSTLPKIPVNTLDWEDGAYDLVLQVQTDQDRTLEVVRRILVENWNVLKEPFAPPIVFFGRSVDSLLTAERSDGWVFFKDKPEAFFGDSQRIASPPGTDEYLIWNHPNLRRFRLEMYARDVEFAQLLRFEAARGGEWNGLGHEVTTLGISPDGWHRLVVTGTIPAEWDADRFRITIPAIESEEPVVQLGNLEFFGLK